MSFERFFSRTALLLAAGTLTLGLYACGSDEDTSGTDTSSAATGTTAQGSSGQGNTGQSGQIKPDKKAPDSAGDRKNAPDDVISERPGGPVSPAKP